MTDYYQTLGIDRSASPEDIKRAFRKQASIHHPDKGGDTKKFQEIQAAYDTLSDPEKKMAYDNPQPQFQQFGGMPPGFEEMFSQAFGGFNNHPFRDIFGRRAQKNKNLTLQTQILLEDAFNGKDITFSIKLPSGREQICEIKIPRGIQDGTTLRLAGMGDDTFANLPRGDVHLTVHISPHSVFHRQGDDLITKLEVDALSAIVGRSFTVETLDKRLLEIKVKPGTQHGTLMAAAGYGMPNVQDNRFVGRLLIQIDIKVPTNLTEEQIEIIKGIV